MDRQVSAPADSKTVPTKPTRLRSFFHSQKMAPYFFVAPFVISFLLFMLYPIISAFYMSFQEILPGEETFVGLKNYQALNNEHFYAAVSNTVIYTIWTLIILIPVPLVLAVLIHSRFMLAPVLFRSALFLPALTSIVVGGAIFRLIFGEMDTAPMNTILIKLGFSPQQWAMEGGTAMFLMVALASWRWMGINLLYFLSGLQNIPKELYESAEIDGAGSLSKFFRITLPLLKPVTIYVLTISIYGGFTMFTESYVFWTNHSPGDIGLTLIGYLYQQSFENFNMGVGSAIGIVLLVTILVINIVQLKLFGQFRREE
ncbi:carbohydrate ABC transporter permease [Brevibacillus migulae]|uniref:carbohydrate ABC transporter permease n=1 Tax=Brevibacillus migulae TaxID=1644114 RepID=UPI00106EDC8A